MKFGQLKFPALLLVLFCVAASSSSAKDNWTQVKSANFVLIGNASEGDIKRVAVRLEQFRETFRQLFSRANLTGSRPTRVVVFKDDSAYKPFKPKRSDGKADTFIAGYFQPGDDVNYITLSAAGDDRRMFAVIFHEYVHFIIDTNFGKTRVPQWFNEGLAEYYTTFEISDGQKARIGLPQPGHLTLLQQSQLMPLEMLLNTSNQQLHQSGGHSRSIFYAQSWALVHYLIQNGRSAQLDRFLSQITAGTDSRKAFEDAFETSYSKMETELRRYVAQRSYRYSEVTFKNKLSTEPELQSSALDEATSHAYLGDLLYHANREDDAEPYLSEALRLSPDLGLANTTMGMVRLKQRKFAEARGFLEKAIAADPKNYLALYQFAYLVSRDGRDEFGYVQRFEPAAAAAMRDALRKAIAANPSFTESHELLAFVALVTNEGFDEAVEFLKAAIGMQPGNQRYALRLAEVYSRQKKFTEAASTAESIARTAEDAEIKARARSLLDHIARVNALAERGSAERPKYDVSVIGPPKMVKRIENVPEPSAAELAKMLEDANMRSLNESIRVPLEGEARLIGRIEKVVCRAGTVLFEIRTSTQAITLTSRDFQSLALTSLDPAATNAEVGCGAGLASHNAVITYRPEVNSKAPSLGTLIAIDFVPANFRFMTAEEMAEHTVVIFDEPARRSSVGKTPPSAEDLDSDRRDKVLESMKSVVRVPAAGEKRDLGFLEAIECTSKGSFFLIRTPDKTLRLTGDFERLPIKIFVLDLNGTRFSCGMKPIEFPVVVVYSDRPDAKAKTDGSAVSLEFMPKAFVL